MRWARSPRPPTTSGTTTPAATGRPAPIGPTARRPASTTPRRSISPKSYTVTFAADPAVIQALSVDRRHRHAAVERRRADAQPHGRRRQPGPDRRRARRPCSTSVPPTIRSIVAGDDLSIQNGAHARRPLRQRRHGQRPLRQRAQRHAPRRRRRLDAHAQRGRSPTSSARLPRFARLSKRFDRQHDQRLARTGQLFDAEHHRQPVDPERLDARARRQPDARRIKTSPARPPRSRSTAPTRHSPNPARRPSPSARPPTASATIAIGTTTSGGTLTTGTGLFTINKTGTVTLGSGSNTGSLLVDGDLTINGGVLQKSNAGSTFDLAAGKDRRHPGRRPAHARRPTYRRHQSNLQPLRHQLAPRSDRHQRADNSRRLQINLTAGAALSAGGRIDVGTGAVGSGTLTVAGTSSTATGGSECSR